MLFMGQQFSNQVHTITQLSDTQFSSFLPSFARLLVRSLVFIITFYFYLFYQWITLLFLVSPGGDQARSRTWAQNKPANGNELLKMANKCSCDMLTAKWTLNSGKQQWDLFVSFVVMRSLAVVTENATVGRGPIQMWRPLYGYLEKKYYSDA